MEFRVLNMGERALTFEFGNTIEAKISHAVLGVHLVLRDAIKSGNHPGLIESVPTFRSFTVHFDPMILFPDDVEEIVRPYIEKATTDLQPGARWLIPSCYETDFAPDIQDVSKRTNLSIDEVIEIHSHQTFEVLMLGFLPGFAFSGVVDERLQLPRRKEPRTAVPERSVAIANQMAAVYPSESPGGWNLIGTTPIEMFDLSYENPVLLKAGDLISYRPITASEYEEIRQAVLAGEYDPRIECKLEGAGA